ncbi:MAG: hypothetical protein KDD56_10025, partial [Bdellovibrionales bacterium]|nr:hypothetical protein [Bdellovibrionales bacterium]
MEVVVQNKPLTLSSLKQPVLDDLLPWLLNEHQKLFRKELRDFSFLKTTTLNGQALTTDLKLALEVLNIKQDSLSKFNSKELARVLDKIKRRAAKKVFFSLIQSLPDLPVTVLARGEIIKQREVLQENNPAQSIIDFFLSGIDLKKLVATFFSKNNYSDTHKGISISLEPFSAIDCIKDWVRTKKFVCAVLYATQDLLKEKEPGKALQVIDAGCGPIPLLGLTAALVSPRVNVTLIESNPI